LGLSLGLSAISEMGSINLPQAFDYILGDLGLAFSERPISEPYSFWTTFWLLITSIYSEFAAFFVVLFHPSFPASNVPICLASSKSSSMCAKMIPIDIFISTFLLL
jgi:hypothetical protein